MKERLKLMYDYTTVRIVIPTCKKAEDYSLLDQSFRIEQTRFFKTVTLPNGQLQSIPVYYSCTDGSAAQNRNNCLKQCNVGDFVVMLDDDISGFEDAFDLQMIQPIMHCSNVVLVSARLLNADGTKQIVMGGQNAPTYGLAEVQICPTACIAFQWDGETWFDEAYQGSGWEDTDFCKKMRAKHKKAMFVINNNIRLIHHNEQKNQQGEVWVKNRAYYNQKWGAHE